MNRPVGANPRDRLGLAVGNASVRRPPALLPGQALRQLKRKSREDYDDAIARAGDMPWWPRVVGGETPYTTATMWVWIVGPVAP